MTQCWSQESLWHTHKPTYWYWLSRSTKTAVALIASGVIQCWCFIGNWGHVRMKKWISRYNNIEQTVNSKHALFMEIAINFDLYHDLYDEIHIRLYKRSCGIFNWFPKNNFQKDSFVSQNSSNGCFSRNISTLPFATRATVTTNAPTLKCLCETSRPVILSKSVSTDCRINA